MAGAALLKVKPRVLVVDDKENITNLVATALRYDGFRVEMALSGRAASAAATSFSAAALPLTEVGAAQRRLLLIGGAVSGLALVAIGVAAYWLSRRELRPLERMAEQSGAIAAGDLSQRVKPDDPRTEVGRPGGGLNAVLAQISEPWPNVTEVAYRRRVAVIVSVVIGTLSGGPLATRAIRPTARNASGSSHAPGVACSLVTLAGFHNDPSLTRSRPRQRCVEAERTLRCAPNLKPELAT